MPITEEVSHDGMDCLMTEPIQTTPAAQETDCTETAISTGRWSFLTLTVAAGPTAAQESKGTGWAATDPPPGEEETKSAALYGVAVLADGHSRPPKHPADPQQVVRKWQEVHDRLQDLHDRIAATSAR